MWVPYASFAIAFTLIVIVQSVVLVLHVRALVANDESIARALDVAPEDDADLLIETEKGGLDVLSEENREDER